MYIANSISRLCRATGTTQYKLAALLGMSAGNLSSKLKRETIKGSDMERITNILGCRLEYRYISIIKPGRNW